MASRSSSFTDGSRPSRLLSRRLESTIFSHRRCTMIIADSRGRTSLEPQIGLSECYIIIHLVRGTATCVLGDIYCVHHHWPWFGPKHSLPTLMVLNTVCNRHCYQAFVSLTLFNMLQGPLNYLPMMFKLVSVGVSITCIAHVQVYLQYHGRGKRFCEASHRLFTSWGGFLLMF